MEDSQDENSCVIQQETETEEYVQMDQETQGVPELEAPPPPVVSTIPTSAPILSTLRVKEPAQIMVQYSTNLFHLFYYLCPLLTMLKLLQ